MQKNVLSVLPLRDVVVYPHMVIPMIVGRLSSIQALEQTLKCGKQIFLVAQKNATIEKPTVEDLYVVGTVANVLQLLKLPDNTLKILVEGVERGRVKEFVEQQGAFTAEVEIFKDIV